MSEKKFAVGQKWMTKGGKTLNIVAIGNEQECYPIKSMDEQGGLFTHTEDGSYWGDGGEYEYDLSYLVTDEKCNDVVVVNETKAVPVDNSKPDALNIQEGGDHYKTLKIQPVEYIVANNLSFLQGNVVKYITRYKQKNGPEDIKKVIHYCQLILALEYDQHLTMQETAGKITNPVK